MNVLRLFGGMLTRPLATLSTIVRDGAAAWPPIVVYVVVTILLQLKVLLRLWFLLDDGGATIGRRIRDALIDDADTDLALLGGTVVVLAILARVMQRSNSAAVSPARAAVAAVWLLVPLIVLKCIGGALQAAGVDLWFLPHEAVDSMAVVVDKHVSWLRFTVKSIVAYGPSVVMGAALVWSWRTSTSTSSSSSSSSAGSTPTGSLALAGAGVVGVALAALLVASTISAVQASDRIRPLQPGDALPEVALRKLDDKGVSKQKVKLSSFRGKVLVLDFWASWCTPCKRSMPELSQLQDELGARGLVILGVNREPSSPKDAAASWAKIHPSFEGVMDDRYFGDKIGLTTLPTSYVVDKKGVVRHLHLGYTEPSILRGEIEALLVE
jgi:cytochrome c biogenesis protein CcmG, thiol:disulfide interchange protein DsbE